MSESPAPANQAPAKCKENIPNGKDPVPLAWVNVSSDMMLPGLNSGTLTDTRHNRSSKHTLEWYPHLQAIRIQLDAKPAPEVTWIRRDNGFQLLSDRLDQNEASKPKR